MNSSSPLQGGTMRRARAWRLPIAVGALLLAATGTAVITTAGGNSAHHGAQEALSTVSRPNHHKKHGRAGPAGIHMNGGPKVHVQLRPRAGGGLLFDLDTGHVLWSHDPFVVRPIASLTKIMTAVLVVE